MGVRAIDVSRWQGSIDWIAVRNDGVRAAWIKVGGADGGQYKDSKADANLAGAEAAGLPYGTYYFCSPTLDSAVAQARHAVSVGHGRGQLWPAADLENNPHGLSRQQLDEWLAAFCSEVRRLTGRESIWYGNPNVGVGYTSSAPRCPVWIANYGRVDTPGVAPAPGFNPPVPPQYGGWDIWQFNSVTRVAGISGTVDQDVIADEFWALMTTTTTEEDDMAPPVIQWTKPDSEWATVVAGRPENDRVAAFLAYPSSGIIVWIRNPDQLNGDRFVGIKDQGPVDDQWFYNYTLQPHNGRPPGVGFDG